MSQPAINIFESIADIINPVAAKAEAEAILLDLGYMNSWDKTPDVVKKCKHQRHHAAHRDCVTEVWCTECKFTYKIDSGD